MNMIKIHGMYVQSSQRSNKHMAILKSPFTRILLRSLILPTRCGGVAEEGVLPQVPTAVTTHHYQTHFQRKEGFFEKNYYYFLKFPSHTSSLREVRTELKAGTRRKERKQKPWTNNAQPRTTCHLPKKWHHHGKLSPPTPIINKANAPQTSLHVN